MAYTKINDINIYYEIKGQGASVVLINGVASTVAENRWLIDQLAEKYRVLTLDNRGAGLTDKPDIPYSIEMMAADTAGLMHELRFDSAAVIGVSMGGRIALSLTINSPELVNKLVLVSTSARVVSSGRKQFILKALHRLQFNADTQPVYSFKRQLEASSAYDATIHLPEIHIPVLILHGKTDHVASYILAQEMSRGIAGSKMITFNGGHLFFMMGERGHFLTSLVEFLG